MTEAEWLACDDPTLMTEVVLGRASDRRLRLVACGCCREKWWRFSDQQLELVEAAERYADGILDEAEREDLHQVYVGGGGSASPEFRYAGKVPDPLTRLASECLAPPGHDAEFGWGDSFSQPERPLRVTIVRDIFGNPFRPVTLDPAWLTSTAVAVAKGMYESRDFSPMPILADALQDAGCTSEDVLSHCRGGGLHVRGCWVVDLVLGKS
jgi:hypothetical protein